MTSILDLLTEKNHFLDKFYNLNESEILNFVDGNFDNLDQFYNSREKILSILSEIDKKIDEETVFGEEACSPREKIQIVKALDYKSEKVTRILSQDLQILSYIENAKSQIIKELANVKSTKEIIGNYKSTQTKGPEKINESV